MFLRYKVRRKDGKEHRYWSIVENRRVSGGRTVQRQVLYLGEINDGQKAAWCRTIEAFDEAGQDPRQIALFPEDRRRQFWIAMWCMSGSADRGCTGRGSGAPAGWPAICGINCGWMTSGRYDCRPRDRERVG